MTRAAPRPRRVLHVVTSLDVGGIETNLLNVLRRFDRRRFQMDVCYTGPVPGLLQAQVRAEGGALFACRRTNSMVPYSMNLSRLLRERGYDAVCDHAGDFAAASLWAARVAGLGVRLAYYQSSGARFRPTLARKLAARALRRLTVRQATTVLSNSSSNLRQLFPRGLPGGRAYAIVPNGIDTAAFAPVAPAARHAARAELGLPVDAPVVGHVGSFTPPKAHDVLLEAFAGLAAARPAARLVLVGDGPLRPAVERRAQELGLAGKVVLTGVRQDVPRLLSALDLFAFPSRFEGLPNALLEAQSVGLAVVASDRPEMREALPAANHDCLVPVGDPQALAARMQWLVDEPRAAARKAAAGAEFVRAHFALDRSLERFCAELEGGA